MSEKRSMSNREDNGRNSVGSTDDPPMSRLFIICNKSNTEEDFRKCFSQFGTIEEIWMVKDKATGDNKGVVYIKFSKTSEAAIALEEMNGKSISVYNRPIKVLVASNRQQGSRKFSENEQEKCFRLFVIIPKDMGESELSLIFGQYGELENVSIIRDKITKEGKGFAYIKFRKFSNAAIAFENCDAKYKAVFAEPKPAKNQTAYSEYMHSSNSRNSNFSEMQLPSPNLGRSTGNNDVTGFTSATCPTTTPMSREASLNVVCSATVNQDQLWRLFDIIPGLDYCQITSGRISSQATVVYNNQESAAYAKEKLHGFEYPPGERLIVKPGSDLNFSGIIRPEAVFTLDGSNSSKDVFCSVTLPPLAPMASNPNGTVAQRCFFVCIPQPLSSKMLRNIFSRFSDLLDVYLLPNKNCGYAKYAKESSCKHAIETLHGAEICGIRLKVMEAEELSDDRRKRLRRDD